MGKMKWKSHFTLPITLVVSLSLSLIFFSHSSSPSPLCFWAVTSSGAGGRRWRTTKGRRHQSSFPALSSPLSFSLPLSIIGATVSNGGQQAEPTMEAGLRQASDGRETIGAKSSSAVAVVDGLKETHNGFMG